MEYGKVKYHNNKMLKFLSNKLASFEIFHDILVSILTLVEVRVEVFSLYLPSFEVKRSLLAMIDFLFMS